MFKVLKKKKKDKLTIKKIKESIIKIIKKMKKPELKQPKAEK